MRSGGKDVCLLVLLPRRKLQCRLPYSEQTQIGRNRRPIHITDSLYTGRLTASAQARHLQGNTGYDAGTDNRRATGITDSSGECPDIESPGISQVGSTARGLRVVGIQSQTSSPMDDCTVNACRRATSCICVKSSLRPGTRCFAPAQNQSPASMRFASGGRSPSRPTARRMTRRLTGTSTSAAVRPKLRAARIGQ